jgi:RNA-binding protein 39
MFDPATETEPNWNLDITDDVSEECSKFGRVEHCFVETRKPGGLVFIKFTALQAAVSAAHSMNGRYFAGRMITVTYLDPVVYNSLVA